MVAGLFFIMAGTIGVLRLPDFYTRLHAAGMTDTLGAELILLALIFQADSLQMVLKLMLVAFFLLITSPTATHAVAHAAYRAGLKPLLGAYRAPDLEEETGS
jgi:multicomponent Na+:H+ antiporter subunit G